MFKSYQSLLKIARNIYQELRLGEINVCLLDSIKSFVQKNLFKVKYSTNYCCKCEPTPNDYRSTKSNYLQHALFPFFVMTSLLAKEKNEEEGGKSPMSRRQHFNFIADVVEEVLPSIVQIEIREQRGFFGMGESFTHGSGFLISEDGVILTNAHVIGNLHGNLNIKLHDNRTFMGRVVKIDKSYDLAIIKIECVKFLKYLYKI